MSEPGAATPLVGIVVVSHSRRLAEGVVELARQMAGDDVALEAVGGAPDGSLGTDADGIATAIGRADSGAGVVILADLGSAILASKSALELLDGEAARRVVISGAPVVEGAVIGAVQASIGQTVEEVLGATEEARSMDKGVGG
jgi:phosphoenolpyruvate---glycerone phosphotransferase subunit DhaM